MWLIKLICFIFVACVIVEILSLIISIMNGMLMFFVVVFNTFKNLIERLINVITKTKEYLDKHYYVKKVKDDEEMKY